VGFWAVLKENACNGRHKEIEKGQMGVSAGKPEISFPNTSPVTVVVGGTSGIGQGVADVFARETNGKAKLIIVGRNAQTAQDIFASLPTPELKDNYEFVQCDVSLMKNVTNATQQIAKSVPKINYLVMSAGAVNLEGRVETEEGLEKMLAVTYYSRWKFINEMMPLLEKAEKSKEDAKVLSIFAAGGPAAMPVDVDDLAMKKNFSLNAPGTYNDLMIEVSSCWHSKL
jgi:NAD(P)-dependent dehydrogenase (short-subunit alcohol dehydrogenase family)